MGQHYEDLFDSLAALQGPEETIREIDCPEGAARPFTEEGTSTAGAATASRASRARPDFGREKRKGVPEVILAETKQPEDVLSIARGFLESTGRALISRASQSLLDRLSAEFADYSIETFAGTRVIVIRTAGGTRPKTGGKVGIITAGTSDIPIAEEARVVAQEMGCEVLTAFDVGVAGIHRIFQPLRTMIEAPVDALIVAAGMDGALPSVVAGLVDVPVIGLPTSTGYGLGGKGVTALLSMLQTCSPGLVVVNIDNGVGAAATAALIANRMARARQSAEAKMTEGQRSRATRD